MAAEIVLAQSGQISEAREVGPGARITVIGSGWLEWAPNTLADVRNGVVTWQTWPRGQAPGFADTLRRIVVRARATGAVQVDIDESRKDAGPEGAFWQESQPAWSTDAAGNVAGLVGPDGAVAYVTAGMEHGPADLDWLGLRSSYDWTTLNIPSPYSPTHVLHPSVVFFESGWCGFRYWMAYTPYPNSDAELENPCVAASNDGLSWIAVGAQPLVPSPPGLAFNSDTDLVYDAVGNRLALLFRDNGVPGSSDMRLRVMVSEDGRNWTDPVTIYSGGNVGGAASTDILSPSLVWNPTAARWEIFGINGRDTGNTWPLVQITSPSLLSGWTTSLTQLTMAPLLGRKWWHGQIRRLSGGGYVGLMQDNANVVGGGGNLHAVYSADGTTFATRLLEDVSVTGANGHYRPSFVVRQDSASREWVCHAFASRLNTSGILTQIMRFDAASAETARLAEIGALLSAGTAGNVTGLLHADNFNRGDDATGLGTASGGGTYTQPGGPTNVIGISGNRAYNVTTGNCRAVRDMGRADYFARATIVAKGTEQYVVVRYIDGTNLIRVGVQSGTGQIRFQVITSGSVSVDVQLGRTPLAGDEIGVRCCGGEIVTFLNGRRLSKHISLQGVSTGTFAGLQISGTAGFMDNFVVTAVS
jgi:hypothetical protein